MEAIWIKASNRPKAVTYFCSVCMGKVHMVDTVYRYCPHCSVPMDTAIYREVGTVEQKKF